MSLNPSVEPQTTITGYEQHGEGRSTYVTYTIKVIYQSPSIIQPIQWTVNRRYSEFVDLYKYISSVYSNVDKLPDKTWYKPKDWFHTLDSTFIEYRLKELNNWLQHIKQYEFVIRSLQYKNFILFTQNVHNDIYNTEFVPKQLSSQITVHTQRNNINLQHGINQTIYIESSYITLCACEQPSILSRLNASAHNITIHKTTWDYIKSFRSRNQQHQQPQVQHTTVPNNNQQQNNNSNVPLGSFNVLHMNTNNAKWDVIHTITYDAAATAIAYNEQNDMVYIGLDNGKIYAYRINDNYTTFNQANVIQPHTARITGLVYNNEHNTLISISRDKKIVTTDLHGYTIQNTTITNFSLECIESDLLHSRIFIGNVAGSIAIYDVSNSNGVPDLVHTLHGHTNTLRCLYYNTTYRYLFSGSYDYTVGIWNIVSSDNDSAISNKLSVTRSRIVGWLKNTPSIKIKSIVYSSSDRQVITGLADGRYAVYNTDNGQLINIVNAHDNQIKCLHWIDNNRVLLTGSLDGTMKYWKWQDRSAEDDIQHNNIHINSANGNQNNSNTNSNPLSNSNIQHNRTHTPTNNYQSSATSYYNKQLSSSADANTNNNSNSNIISSSQKLNSSQHIDNSNTVAQDFVPIGNVPTPTSSHQLNDTQQTTNPTLPDSLFD